MRLQIIVAKPSAAANFRDGENNLTGSPGFRTGARTKLSSEIAAKRAAPSPQNSSQRNGTRVARKSDEKP